MRARRNFGHVAYGLLKLEGNMFTGEWRVLSNNLVAEASEKALKKDGVRINCFARTGYLMSHIKSEAGDLIKPQGSKSKTVVPDSHVEDDGHVEFIASVTSGAPEEIALGNIDLDIYDDSVASESNDNNEWIAIPVRFLEAHVVRNKYRFCIEVRVNKV